MRKIFRVFVAVLFIVLFLGISGIAEEITLTTYYPAPYGVYEEIRVTSDTQLSERIRLSGQEFYQAGWTSTDGVAFLLGVNRPNNCQLWIADSAKTAQSSANTVIRIMPNGTTIDAIATNGTTTKQLVLGNASGVKMNGNVGIGIAPEAKLHVDGNIKADFAKAGIGAYKYLKVKDSGQPTERGEMVWEANDLAELFNTIEEVEAGDVLVIDETTDIQLRKCDTVYDKTVAGIASAFPAVLFEGSSLVIGPPDGFTKGTKPPVALAGRVPCKVSIENGPIERGDMLTTSSTPGHAMKALDRERSFGAILGKALQPFSGGAEGETTGTIVVLVTLQ